VHSKSLLFGNLNYFCNFRGRVATSWKSLGFFLLSWKVLEFCL